MNGGARTAAVPPEATAPTETDAQAESIAHQRMARRRRMARRKKPQLLLETAYEQRRADGGRAPHRQKPTRRRRASLQQQSSRRRNLPRRKKPLPLPGTAHEPRRVGRCCRADGMTCECGAPPAHDPNDPARQLPKPQRAENHTLSDKAARCHAASVQGGRYGRPARFSCTHSTAATARHPHSPLSKNKKAVQHRCGTPAGFHSFPFPIRFLFFGSFFSFSERKERTEKRKENGKPSYFASTAQHRRVPRPAG